MLENKYEYPNLKRIQTKKGRQYTDGTGEPVPSVTTILGDTGDKTALIAWRKRVGDAEATRISTESAGLGTKVHNSLEKYILQEDYEIKGNNHISVMAKNMVSEMIDKGLSKVDTLYGVEVGLIAEGLYAGTADGIGMHEGEEAIIDFKTAKKIKKREWIEDYYIQLAAYIMAHDALFGTKMEAGVILMASRGMNLQMFTINGQKLDDYKYKWLKKCEKYYNLEG